MPRSARRSQAASTAIQRDGALQWMNTRPTPVPEVHRARLHPSTVLLDEWRDYWVRCDEADHLRVGDTRIAPTMPGLFCVRFANRLGATTLQAERNGAPLGAELHADVVAQRFATIDDSLAMVDALLHALHNHHARWSSTAAPTRVRVMPVQNTRDPDALLHLLDVVERTLPSALTAIARAPHRALQVQTETRTLRDVPTIDADAVMDLVQHPEHWRAAAPSSHRGATPSLLRQRTLEETFDTDENRAARAVLLTLRRVLHVADKVLATHQQSRVQSLLQQCEQALRWPVFAVHGAARIDASRARTRLREGYRELHMLAELLQRSMTPTQTPFASVAAVRDIATLYELWCYYALIDKLAALFKTTPVLSHATPVAGCEARFDAHGTLRYNARVEGYSGPLRPDFIWCDVHGAALALDAKFRLQLPNDARPSMREVLRDDLDKMHTYRDALGVRAAIALFPGERSVFHARDGSVLHVPTLDALLQPSVQGIGALAFTPEHAQ